MFNTQIQVGIYTLLE